MDEVYYEAIDLLKKLISTPSISRDEEKAGDVVARFLADCGFEVNRHGNNVWVTAPDYSVDKPTILLNSHIDTVKPASGWTHNPFEAEDDGEKIYGLGSNDAGASVVSLIAAFRMLAV